MDSQTYWRNRETEQRKHDIRDEAEYQKHIREIYQNMIDEIEKEINGFYGKYAKKEGITLAEAKKRAAKADIEALGRKAAKYVKEKNFSKQANEEMRLYNLTMKVNRLELLKAQIGLEMVAGFDELQKYYDEKLTDRTIAEFERQAGILGKTIQDNAKAANAIVNASFHNATFSDRIWMYQDMLKNELSSLLQTGLIQGQNPRRLATHLRKRFGVSQSNAERLLITEMARVQTEAQKQSFERNGFEEYTFLALGTACSICRALDGKHFKVSKMMSGTNAPPMHPNCRCSVAAYEDSEDYEDWLDFLSKGGTTEEWNKLKRKSSLKEDDDYQKRIKQRRAEKQAEKIAENLNDDKKDAIIKPPKRKQYEPYDSLNKKKSNQRALELIQKETGYDEKTAKTVKKYLDEYFGDDYSEFVDGNRQKEVKIIDEALSRMGAYDGEIFRGLEFGSGKRGQEFADRLKVGGEIEMKSISSWSSERWVADKFAGVGNDSYYSVVFVCKDNKTGVGVQHISEFGKDEAEVLSPSGTKWKITNISQADKTRTNIMGNKVPVTDVSGNILKEVIVEVTEV